MKYEYDIIWNGYTLCPTEWGMVNATEVFYRIYYVYGGEAYYTYRGETQRLQPGYLYLFPVMQPYTMWHNPSSPLDVLWFHVELKQQLCMELLRLEIEKNSTLEHLLEALKGMSNHPEQFENLQDLFGVFLSILAEKILVKHYPGRQMSIVLELIDKNIGDELSVEFLAEYIGMERSYFSRKFKQNFQITPNQYIMARKMSVAALSLMNGASVYQAARTAGYHDEKAFSRAFKNYMEITPARYRNSRVRQP